MVTIPPRSAIAREHSWNAESVFPSPDAWAAEVKALNDEIPQIAAKYKGRLGESAATLAEALEAADGLRNRADIVYVYAGMTHAVDTSDQTGAAMYGQAVAVFAKYAAAFAYLKPDLLAIGRERLRAWEAENPRVAIYAFHFDDLHRMHEHVRSAEVEEVLGILSEPLNSVSNTGEVLRDSDLKFANARSSAGAELPVTQGTLHTLLENPDREVRRTAWENYCDQYLAFKNTLASNLLVNLKRSVAISRIRRYGSALELVLAPQNVPVAVFHNLIETFRRHIPIWHRYWAVRRRALKVDTLYHYDIWAPLTATRPKVAYPQAVEFIAAGMRPLGEEYVSVLRRGCLEDRWVDIYPNQGKTQGAFSSGTKGTYPFILMSYDQEITALSTLAHELGHSLHSYLTWQHQPYIYSEYSLFAAEVASNFNQAMVRAHLLKTQTDPAFQLAVLEEAMYNFHRYFFIMPTLARFEFEIHSRLERGAAVSADDMSALMADLFSEGYGSERAVDRQREGITWAQFPHLYADYYVFQYATGISGAHALSNRILRGEPGAAEAYLGFLKAGGSAYPLDALRRAGVDLSTPEPVEQTFAVLADYIDRLDKLV